MANLYKRNTLTKTITFMAMMAAINIILSLLGAYIPVLGVFLIIFFPLTSALVEVTCEDRYFPIYAFGTIGLCIAATFHIIDFAIVYVIPSIITGYIFGLLAKKKLAPIWAILIATIFQTGITFALIPLFDLITEINIVDYTIILLNLDSVSAVYDFVPTTIFVFSLVQILLSFIVCANELKKIGVSFNFDDKKLLPIQLLIIGLVIVSIPLFFIKPGVGYLFTSMSILLTIYFIYRTIMIKDFNHLILYSVVILLSVFFYAILNPVLKDGQFLLLGFSPLFITLSSFIKVQKKAN